MNKLAQGGFFSGKKTYITAITGIVTAIGLYLTGDADLANTVQTVFALAAAAFVRAGIATETNK